MAPSPANVKPRLEAGCSASPVNTDDATLVLVDASNLGFDARIETLEDPFRVRLTGSLTDGVSGRSVLRLRLVCFE